MNDKSEDKYNFHCCAKAPGARRAAAALRAASAALEENRCGSTVPATGQQKKTWQSTPLPCLCFHTHR